MASTRIPILLRPYVTLSLPTSFTVLTNSLGASTNWLLIRFIAMALSADDIMFEPGAAAGREGELEREGEVGVVLVSFLRDWAFWRGEGTRAGVDLSRARKAGRFALVDGLSRLFPLQYGQTLDADLDQKVAHASELHLEQTVLATIKEMEYQDHGRKARRISLFVDGLDFYLAAAGHSLQAVGGMLGKWREFVYCTAVTVAADSPLVHLPSTPLEINHAAFVTSLAHQARLVISVRGLDTGLARDISGVLRITKGLALFEHGVRSDKQQDLSNSEDMKENEMFFLLNADGGVRIWEKRP